MAIKKYYIEMLHKYSNAENYDIQSKWFKTKASAKKWFYSNFDYVSKDMIVYLMTAVFYSENDYDIVRSEAIL